ncbi:putative membrane protein [Tunturiibacter psychrotolerans]
MAGMNEGRQYRNRMAVMFIAALMGIVAILAIFFLVAYMSVPL